MIKVKNVRPGLLLIADARLKLAPGETATVENLTPQMESCLENGHLTRIEPEPEAKPRAKSVGKNAEPRSEPASKTTASAVTAENAGDSVSAVTGDAKSPELSTATSSDHAHIHESIRQILGTRNGERFLRPGFGTNLHELIFEPNDRVLYGLIRHEVMTALEDWEPRVIVTDVVVGTADDDEHLVLVNISYRLISCQVPGNLVFPFYRELE